MNESILRDIMENGCIIPFNKDLDRIPLNKLEYVIPALEEFPEYILVMIPRSDDGIERWFSRCQVTTDGFDFGVLDPSFVYEWIPNIRSMRVKSVTIFGGKSSPYVSGPAKIIFMANGSEYLVNHIYRLEEFDRSYYSGDISLRYKALSSENADIHAVDAIRRYLRDLVDDYDLPDVHSLYPKFTATFNPPAYNHMFEKLIKDRCTVDPWLAKNPNMRLPDDCLKGHRLTDSESMDLIFDGDRPRDKYILPFDKAYCRADVLATLEAFRYYMAFKENNMVPGIKKVIFNKPCTIVLWEDGTKTMVRTQGKARFDKEKGLAMCIAKKALGNKGNYYDEFRKWVK